MEERLTEPRRERAEKHPMIYANTDNQFNSEIYPPCSRVCPRRIGGVSLSRETSLLDAGSRAFDSPGERMMYLKVNLKVCEGCGGLWFRTQDRIDVYCSSCAGRLKG